MSPSVKGENYKLFRTRFKTYSSSLFVPLQGSGDHFRPLDLKLQGDTRF